MHVTVLLEEEKEEEAKLINLLVGIQGSHVLLTNLENKDIQCRYKNNSVEYYIGRENLPVLVDLM